MTGGAPLRRGLPRVAGGPQWPPEGTLAQFTVPVVTTIDVGAGSPEPSASAAATVAAVRRGLPRTAGGEPWPPASATLAFQVVPPVEIDRGGVVGDGPDASSSPVLAADVVAEVPASPQVAPVGDPSSMRPSHRRRRAALAGAAIAIVAAVAAVLLARWFLTGTGTGAAFLARYPGEVAPHASAPVGHPAWLRWQHWLNAFFLVLAIRSGLMVRRTTRPAASWRPRRGGTAISIEVWTHLSLDVLWLLNGAVFWVLLFATGQWLRVVPTTWEVFPNAVSAAVQYISLDWPVEDGWTNYNSLQLLAYFVTIFVAAPLAALTGIRMSPLWPSGADRLNRAYPVGRARAIHFPVMAYFVAFVVVHVVLVLATGARRNLNHMFWGSDDAAGWAGTWVFLAGVVVIAGGVAALRPTITKQLGALFGHVGR